MPLICVNNFQNSVFIMADILNWWKKPVTKENHESSNRKTCKPSRLRSESNANCQEQHFFRRPYLDEVHCIMNKSRPVYAWWKITNTYS